MYIQIGILAYWFAWHIMPSVKGWFGLTKSLKPFDCEKCLGFWLGLAFAIYTKEHWTTAIIHAGLSSFIAIISLRSVNLLSAITKKFLLK